MPDPTILNWLANWYLAQCDGDWEHGSGVRIDTVDNPGWSVSINLEGTAADALADRVTESEHSESDWIMCRIKDHTFEGFGDPAKLTAILETFREWVSTMPIQ